MENRELILFSLYGSLILIIISFIKSQWKNPISYIAAFYFFFGFGPVINYLSESPIYFGIVKSNIPMATFIMFLGIFSLTFPHLILKNKMIGSDVEKNEKHEWEALKIAYVVAIIYALAKMAIMIPLKLMGYSKVALINYGLPQLHYIFLLVELYLCSFFFTVKAHPKLKKFYWANFLIYLMYCLVIGERDFIFTMFSLFVVRTIMQKEKISKLRLIGFAFLLMSIATGIFYFRDESQESTSLLASILGQGSILFINTFVLKIFQNGHEFFYGETFLNSILNLFPSFIYKTDFNSLAWFKNLYAAKSDSGYGFALDAEGYMNFGLIGVILVYLSISFFWRFLLNNFSRSEFFCYLTFFCVGFTMYSIRNDSLALIKGIVYSIIIYNILQVTSYFIHIWRRS